MAEGDERAYGSIITQYGNVIYGHCLLYLKDAEIAEELTQDVLFNLWKQRSDLPSIANFPGYVFIMTRNRAITAFKAKLASSAGPPADGLWDTLSTPDASVEYKQLHEAITRGIELLPPKRKQIFKMSRFEGKTYEEIAVATGIAKSTVKDHILASLVFLRAYMKEEEGIVLTGLFLAYYWAG